MRTLLAITRRELAGFFHSAVAPVVLTVIVTLAVSVDPKPSLTVYVNVSGPVYASTGS